MPNNDYMYAIERSDEYLAHYGIKGMKWGVRKALESGNSRALARQYKKASRKLAKLQARAENGKKYARRAAALGAGAATLGGAAVAGTQGIATAMKKVGAHGGSAMVSGGNLIKRAGNAMTSHGIRGGGRVAAVGSAINKAGGNVSTALYKSGRAVDAWGKGNGLATGAANAANKLDANITGRLASRKLTNNDALGAIGDLAGTTKRQVNRSVTAQGISNNTIARIGAGAAAAGLAGAAGYNAYRAATTKRAAKKAAEFQREMNAAFKGTQYANGGQSSGNKKRRRRK